MRMTQKDRIAQAIGLWSPEAGDKRKDHAMPTSHHTPGPWKVGDGQIYSVADNLNLDESLIVVFHPNGWKAMNPYSKSPDKNPEIAQANARLITAAPELLAALIAILAYPVTVELPEPLLTTTRAAISKATGEGN